MSGFKIDIKSAPWWSIGQIQYEVISPDGICVYRTPDFGLSLRVREVWESIPGWASLLKEKVEMTDAQKDAIVKAAQEYDRVHGERGCPLKEGKAISAAVRAAEQRWTVTQTGTGHLVQLRYESVIMVDLPDSHVNSAFLARIARLLNEDDAKGGPA
jgi:hypothetical protein